jgi:peptidyl-prolyl cis-trans isomerase SurA
MFRTSSRLLLAGAALSLAITATPALAEPVTIDRIVAVVGDRPLLLSELRARAAPLLPKLDEKKLTGEAREKAERDLASEILQRMIDAELVAQAADRAQIHASATEVDEAIARIAAQNKVSVPELLASVSKAGIVPAAYRRQIGAQIREAKLLRMRPLPRGVKLSELDERKQTEVLERVRREWMLELRRTTYVELRPL